MQRRHYARFTLVLCGVLAGCGSGGGTTSGTPPTPAVTATPAPTATPSPTPVPTPPGALALSATSASLVGSSQQGTFTATEGGYNGNFTVTIDSACAGIVSNVTPMTAAGPSATFTVTTGTSAGTCNVYVSDSYGQKVTFSVSVAQVNGVLN